ncbi:MAG: potassium transporter TrkA [Desulfobulbaceae bacterium BRH_c16a]|nr:MAG: potassium transporter TrkA [Desulfobulbaceae bacterium BRH_c16a]KJS02738.1 MAG: potassium transporter TrkA [Desulfobulbaceae bacterium BRH_c16a]
MKILIYGASEVGYMAALRLSRNHDITILDEHDGIPEKFGHLDVSYVNGSGADVNALEQAETAAKDLFIACSTRDEANVVACWTVKRIADIETMCFIRTLELYNNLMLYSQGRYRAPYDIDTVIWPEQLLTEDIFRIVSVPEAIDVEHFAKGRAKLFEYRIKQDSTILNKRIIDCVFPKNVLIVGIMRDNKLFIPDGSTVILLNDKVVFMGTGVALDILAARFFQKSNKIRKVALIGGGSVGFLLAKKLEQARIRVTIIENDKERCLFLANNLKKSLILNGDGTDFELLESESIGDTDAIICVTNNDEKNLLCSLLVKQISKGRIITRVGNMQAALLFDRVGIDVVVSPREAALKELLNRVQADDVNIIALIEGGQGEVLRVTVPEGFPESRVVDLTFSAKAVIGAIQRGKQVIVPHGETTLKGGDLLHIFTMAADAEAIKKMFAPRNENTSTQ